MTKKRLFLALFFGFLLSAELSAADFFTTTGFKFTKRVGQVSLSTDIEFPVEGNEACMKSVKLWLCDLLEVDAPEDIDESIFERLLEESFAEMDSVGGKLSRHISVHRAYEDGSVVTFLAEITDKDSTTWRSDDVASFSKADGHRLDYKEIFKCNDQKVKELMWQFRGDLKPDVPSANDLVIGDAGFIDGWVVVIGPAEGYTGAAYKIRYQVAEPYLKGDRSGEYYSEVDD